MLIEDRFTELAKQAVDGLREYYSVLVEEKRSAVYAAIKDKYQDTGNDQADYETLRDAVEAEARQMEAQLSDTGE